MIKPISLAGLVITLMWTAASAQTPEAPNTESITTTTSDGVVIHGETYFGDLDAEAVRPVAWRTVAVAYSKM